MRAFLKLVGGLAVFLAALFAAIKLMIPTAQVTYDLCVILFIAGSIVLLLGFIKELTGDHESTFGWITSGFEIVLFYACGFFALVGIVRFFVTGFVSFIKPGVTGFIAILIAAALGIVAYVVHQLVPVLDSED